MAHKAGKFLVETWIQLCVERYFLLLVATLVPFHWFTILLFLFFWIRFVCNAISGEATSYTTSLFVHYSRIIIQSPWLKK